MIDFHTHILPGIDDGSRDENMTEAMLSEEQKQGVQLIAATPHFYANRDSVDGFLERRAEALNKAERIRANAAAAGEALPELVVGAEVYYFRGMGQAKDIPKLCVTRRQQTPGSGIRTETSATTPALTDTLLLEMPFEQWDEGVVRDVLDLIRKQRLNIVLAHVERYIEFQKNRKYWDEVMELPLTTQINAGSFLRKSSFLRPDKKKKFSVNWLREHPRMILGSDCHNLTSRKPNVGEARKVIAKELGEEALRGIDEATREALELA